MGASCMQKRWVDNPEGRACEIPYICVHASSQRTTLQHDWSFFYHP